MFGPGPTRYSQTATGQKTTRAMATDAGETSRIRVGNRSSPEVITTVPTIEVNSHLVVRRTAHPGQLAVPLLTFINGTSVPGVNNAQEDPIANRRLPVTIGNLLA